MAELYQQKIMRHYQQPQNRGKLKAADLVLLGNNPFCGDQVEIYLKLDSAKKIKEVGWLGAGCVISQASMSLFSQVLKGKTLAQAKKIKSEKIIKELGIKLSPTRLKCALLPLYAIKEQGN
ncbi:MAG: iron-sulfur cluster assembly scaffold protein [Candidatus Buchananbacteria bacterium]